MSRTPLFRILQRAARTAQAGHDRAEPLDELLDRITENRRAYSRRRFLQTASGAAGGVFLSGCAPLPRTLPVRTTSAAEVVVVGAGIAGLTAAYRLQQAGVRVNLHEAQTRIGGRMLSLRGYFPDEQVVELGGELIDTSHTRIRGIAQELGIALDDLQMDDPVLRSDIWFCDGRSYSEAEIIRAFVPLAAAIQRELARLPDTDITYADPGGVEALDRLSIAGWMDREGISGWLRRLIEVAYTTEMGLECAEQSALNFLTFIDPETEHFHIFGESDERFHVRGGNDRIVQALAAKLAPVLQTDSVLEALSQNADGSFRLSLRQGSASRQLRATHVILALPVTLLRQVRLDLPLPPAKLRAIRETRYGTNAKLMIGFSERVWRNRYHSNGSVYSDLPFQTTWETSRLQAGRGGILTNFTGGRHGLELGQDTPRAQADKAARELEAIFPGISQARAGAKEVRFHWPSNPWVQGSYMCLAPGHWTTLRGAIGERVDQLYFAGEHCALDTQGFMEGGCESGETAATQLLQSLGVGRAAEAAA